MITQIRKTLTSSPSEVVGDIAGLVAIFVMIYGGLFVPGLF